jgi:outer membrane protein TolC
MSHKLIFIVLFLESTVCHSQVLTVDNFLKEVTQSHEGYRSYLLDSEGADLAATGASLLFRPQAFSNMRYVYDTRTTHAPSIEGYRNIQRIVSFGVRQQTTLGVQVQFAVDYNQGLLFGTDPNITPNQSVTNFYFVPTFNISLWQNVLGRMDRANYNLQRAQSLASSYGSAFGAQATLVEAEGKYWKLAVTREAIRLQQASVSRAQSLLALEKRKKAKQLIDQSDVLLGEAAVQGKLLELKSLLAEELIAARAFNSMRGIISEKVSEELVLPKIESLQSIPIPTRKGRRNDVLAAEQQAIATSAGQDVARQKLLPNLNIYGSIFAVGLAFSIPIDQGTTQDARDGYAHQSQAAEMNYNRKRFEEENDWSDLVTRFKTTQERLIAALHLEDVQRRKFEDIRRKHEQGLTIAFQVFQYELDFLSGALARLQIEGNLLGVITQMKLYGSEP